MLQFGLIIGLVSIIIDQATILIAVSYLWKPPSVINVFSFLDLTPVENRGISFGLFQDSGDIGRWVIAIFALFIVIFLAVWLRKQQFKFPAFCLGLVIGGALGNVIDRLRQGWVIDFIDFHIGNWHWPAFNFADTFITCGVILLLIDNLLRTQKRHK